LTNRTEYYKTFGRSQLEMEVARAELSTIRPTQLYISARKYRDSLALFEKNGFEEYEPVPVKKIGNDLFFTDGHTRAFILWENGIREINVYDDTDDLDWIMYLVDLEWCRDSRIQSIGDLRDRVVSEKDYREKWIDRCGESHDRLMEDPLVDLEIGFETDAQRKSDICAEILESLPKWFGIEEAVREYVEKVKDLLFVSAKLYGKTVGFCALKINFGINADLYVFGLFEEFHGRGIGSRMVDFFDVYCQQKGIPYMTVKTLSERHPDENYMRTRKFYEHCGFQKFEEFPTLWGEANPCLYMLKKVPD